MVERTPKILIVDDDPRLRDLLRRYLGENGFNVLVSENGEAMKRLWVREHFDVLILDLMMPGEDGLAILKRLRAEKDMTPVIMLTAKGEVFDRIRGKAQAEFAQIFTRVKMPRQYRSSRITKEDVRSLFPAVSDEKELAVLLGVARSVYSIRTAQDIYMKAVELNDTSCEGLRRVAKALQVNPAL